MNFQQMLLHNHTRVRVADINEKKIRKVFDSCKHSLKNPSGPDIIYCFDPLEPKPKSKNGAFTVDGARELSGMVSGIFAANRPVVVVLAYPKYGEEAQNALLKTLEESPSNITICWLYTGDVSLLTTILSRTVDVSASSPFFEKASINDIRQKMTPNQIIRLQKLLVKAGTIPESWIADFKKAIK